jgi:energy-coupling factor transporter ATP-binding protein EcfA2
MTIEYLWIEKFKCFEKQGFNFGGENLFTIDIIKYSANIITISSKKNPAYIKGFYNIHSADQTANITNVTALVGENGSGKTTLFDFIKGYFPDGEGEIDTNCLFVNRNSDGAYTLNVYNEHDVRIEDKTGLDLKIILAKFDSSFRATIVGTKPFRDVNIVFYSSIFDQRFESEVIGLNNISTNYLVRSEKIRLTENKTHQTQFLTDVQAYLNSEIDKQLRFVSYYYKKNKLSALPFTLPDKLIIERTNDRTINDLIKEISSKYKESGYQNPEVFANLLESLRSNLDLRKKFYEKSQRYDLVIISLLSYLVIHTIYCIFHYSIGYVKPEIGKLSFNSDAYEPSFNSLKKIITKLGSVFQVFKSNFRNLDKLHKHLVVAFESQSIEYWNITDRYVYNINNKSISDLSRFLELYYGTQVIEGGLKFNWSGFSSGQIALFSMYSRLHYLVDSPFEPYINQENVLLLLDEPDVLMHPEWQRCFIESIIKFISLDYANDSITPESMSHRQIQIVFSTNNPLALSDLLPTNVVKLDRHSDGRDSKIIDCYEEGGNSTFGANLYNLLDDAFFFDNDYIGSFAKLKIEQIREIILDIEKSNGQNIDNAIMTYMQTLISAIGEPIIKSHLTMRLEDAILTYKGDNNFLNKLKNCLTNREIEGETC